MRKTFMQIEAAIATNRPLHAVKHRTDEALFRALVREIALNERIAQRLKSPTTKQKEKLGLQPKLNYSPVRFEWLDVFDIAKRYAKEFNLIVRTWDENGDDLYHEVWLLDNDPSIKHTLDALAMRFKMIGDVSPGRVQIQANIGPEKWRDVSLTRVEAAIATGNPLHMV